MKNMLLSILSTAKAQDHMPQAMHLTRTFVETGDERCPIAGIWSRLAESDRTTDEPELLRLAMGSLFSWRASFSAYIPAI